MKLQLFLLPVFLCLILSSASARTFLVGPTRTFKKPTYVVPNVKDGDTVLIDSAEYIITSDLIWTANNLLIRGVGGRPRLKALSYVYKGIFELSGANITVENIEFCNSKLNDAVSGNHNGSGIRMSGTGATLRHCYFHDNQDGVDGWANGGNVLIEYCEFAGNGDRTGYTHNLYIFSPGCDTLIYRYNYSHHAWVGHLFKSRAHVNYILYNRIMDEDTGTASYQIDIPDGGLSYVIGNLLQKGPTSQNPSAFISYARESRVNPGPHALYVVNNTFSCQYLWGNGVASDTAVDSVFIANNLFAGPMDAFTGKGDSLANLFLLGDEPGVIDLNSYDFYLAPSSPAINAGAALGSAYGFSLVPEFEYVHPCSGRARVNTGAIDIGAYEYDAHPPAIEKVTPQGLFSLDARPNPFNSEITFQWNIPHAGQAPITLKAYDVSGRCVADLSTRISAGAVHWNAARLPKGLYMVKLSAGKRTLTRKITLLR